MGLEGEPKQEFNNEAKSEGELFPNYLQDIANNKKAIRFIEQFIESILARISLPHYEVKSFDPKNPNESLIGDKIIGAHFFADIKKYTDELVDKLNYTQLKNDKNKVYVEVFIGGGVVRNMLEYLYKFIYERMGEGDKKKYSNVSLGTEFHIKQAILMEKETLLSMMVLGVGSDLDIYYEVSFEDEGRISSQQNDLVRSEIIEKLQKYINLVYKKNTNDLNELGCASVDQHALRNMILPVADLKEMKSHLARVLSQSIPLLDTLAFKLRPELSGRSKKISDISKEKLLRMPAEYQDIIGKFLLGFYEYVAPSDKSDVNKIPQQQAIRGLRVQFSMPHLRIGNEAQIVAELKKTLMDIESKNLNLDEKAKQQLQKLVRNAYFNLGGNRAHREHKANPDSPLGLLLRISEALKKQGIGLSSKVKVVLPFFLEKLPIKEDFVASDDIIEKLILPSEKFINDYTDNGKLYHGSDAVAAMCVLRGGFILSTDDQGTAVYGPGVYATNDINTASSYAGSEGMVIPISIAINTSLRIIDWNKISKDEQEILSKKSVQMGYSHVFDMLRDRHTYAIDIIISEHVLIQNQAAIDLKIGLKELLEWAKGTVITSASALSKEKIFDAFPENMQKFFACASRYEMQYKLLEQIDPDGDYPPNPKFLILDILAKVILNGAFYTKIEYILSSTFFWWELAANLKARYKELSLEKPDEFSNFMIELIGTGQINSFLNNIQINSSLMRSVFIKYFNNDFSQILIFLNKEKIDVKFIFELNSDKENEGLFKFIINDKENNLFPVFLKNISKNQLCKILKSHYNEDKGALFRFLIDKELDVSIFIDLYSKEELRTILDENYNDRTNFYYLISRNSSNSYDTVSSICGVEYILLRLLSLDLNEVDGNPHISKILFETLSNIRNIIFDKPDLLFIIHAIASPAMMGKVLEKMDFSYAYNFLTMALNEDEMELLFYPKKLLIYLNKKMTFIILYYSCNSVNKINKEKFIRNVLRNGDLERIVNNNKKFNFFIDNCIKYKIDIGELLSDWGQKRFQFYKQFISDGKSLFEFTKKLNHPENLAFIFSFTYAEIIQYIRTSDDLIAILNLLKSEYNLKVQNVKINDFCSELVSQLDIELVKRLVLSPAVFKDILRALQFNDDARNNFLLRFKQDDLVNLINQAEILKEIPLKLGDQENYKINLIALFFSTGNYVNLINSVSNLINLIDYKKRYLNKSTDVVDLRLILSKVSPDRLIRNLRDLAFVLKFGENLLVIDEIREWLLRDLSFLSTIKVTISEEIYFYEILDYLYTYDITLVPVFLDKLAPKLSVIMDVEQSLLKFENYFLDKKINLPKRLIGVYVQAKSKFINSDGDLNQLISNVGQGLEGLVLVLINLNNRDLIAKNKSISNDVINIYNEYEQLCRSDDPLSFVKSNLKEYKPQNNGVFSFFKAQTKNKYLDEVRNAITTNNSSTLEGLFKSIENACPMDSIKTDDPGLYNKLLPIKLFLEVSSITSARNNREELVFKK